MLLIMNVMKVVNIALVLEQKKKIIVKNANKAINFWTTPKVSKIIVTKFALFIIISMKIANIIVSKNAQTNIVKRSYPK